MRLTLFAGVSVAALVLAAPTVTLVDRAPTDAGAPVLDPLAAPRAPSRKPAPRRPSRS